MNRDIYDRNTRKSYEDKIEGWERESRLEELRERKAEWEADCRSDEELIRRMGGEG